MSRLLLDTHALLWMLGGDTSLPTHMREIIADRSNETLVSVASLWEIAIKRGLGKLQAADDLPAQIEAAGYTWLPVSGAHAWALRSLPQHHRDLFDRMLIVQALTERLPVVTGDAVFAEYGVNVLW